MESVITQPNKTAGAAPLMWTLPGWQRLRQGLEQRPFLRNVSIMLTGTASGQLVSILLSPILTRLYSPQQFGVLSVYIAVVSILAVIASLRYELTIPLASSDDDAINLVAVCACALAITTVAVTVGAFLILAELLRSEPHSAQQRT